VIGPCVDSITEHDISPRGSNWHTCPSAMTGSMTLSREGSANDLPWYVYNVMMQLTSLLVQRKTRWTGNSQSDAASRKIIPEPSAHIGCFRLTGFSATQGRTLPSFVTVWALPRITLVLDWDSSCNIPTCVTEILVGRNEPMRYSISRECLLTLRSYWLLPAHRVFRFTGREVTVIYKCSSAHLR